MVSENLLRNLLENMKGNKISHSLGFVKWQNGLDGVLIFYKKKRKKKQQQQHLVLCVWEQSSYPGSKST